MDEHASSSRGRLPGARSYAACCGRSQSGSSSRARRRRNSLLDLHPQIYLLDEGRRLGKTVTEFHSRYCQQGRSGSEAGGRSRSGRCDPRRKEDLETAISDIVFTPRRQGSPRPAAAAPQRHLGRAAAPGQGVQGDGRSCSPCCTAARRSPPRRGSRLRQVPTDCQRRAATTQTGVHEIHGARDEALDDLVEELSGKPVLVAYQFQQRPRAALEVARGPGDSRGDLDRETEKVLAGWNAGNACRCCTTSRRRCRTG